jgi:tetratricopeptide (TPR) repeat protein
MRGAVERARAASPRTERDWIEAMAAFFRDHEHVDQRTRTLAYEAAMERLAAKYPDDDEAQIFHALAIDEAVDFADKTYARQLKAGEILERLAARLPDHPGVTHYLIHTYGYGPLAERGLAAARRYAAVAPASGHALHMPSHIFSTLGLWKEAIPADLAAIASYTEYFGALDPRVAGKPTLIPRIYYSVGFLANAYMQLAQDRKAAALLEPYRAVTEPPPLIYAFHTGFAAAFVRYDFDRGAWAEAAALPVPKTPYPQAKAISQFGRAIGASRSGDPAAARVELEEPHALGGRLADAGNAYWAEQVKSQETAAAAWIAHAEGRGSEAVQLMRAAADLEDRTEKSVAMENRLSPMHGMLGEMLLATGDPTAALHEFEASFQLAPNRYRSIAGAAKAAESIGDRQAARAWHERLLQLTADADTERPEITAAQAFLSTN